VDYKATSKNEKITNINQGWQITYKRQMEIYQWLLRNNSYSVSNTGYFVYCNGQKDKDAFNGKLEFDITLISYKGNDSWVDKTVSELHSCLLSDQVPEANGNCEFCAYRYTVENILSL
jgi:hypothetical protein